MTSTRIRKGINKSSRTVFIGAVSNGRLICHSYNIEFRSIFVEEFGSLLKLAHPLKEEILTLIVMDCNAAWITEGMMERAAKEIKAVENFMLDTNSSEQRTLKSVKRMTSDSSGDSRGKFEYNCEGKTRRVEEKTLRKGSGVFSSKFIFVP